MLKISFERTSASLAGLLFSRQFSLAFPRSGNGRWWLSDGAGLIFSALSFPCASPSYTLLTPTPLTTSTLPTYIPCPTCEDWINKKRIQRNFFFILLFELLWINIKKFEFSEIHPSTFCYVGIHLYQKQIFLNNFNTNV